MYSMHLHHYKMCAFLQKIFLHDLCIILEYNFAQVGGYPLDFEGNAYFSIFKNGGTTGARSVLIQYFYGPKLVLKKKT